MLSSATIAIATRSASFRTGVKAVLTLLVNARQSIFNAMGGRAIGVMASVALALKRRMQDRFSALF